jgi:thiamine monophosphate synthase
VAVELLSVHDLLRADHAGVADVDHVRVGHVQRDPKADQKDDAER